MVSLTSDSCYSVWHLCLPLIDLFGSLNLSESSSTYVCFPLTSAELPVTAAWLPSTSIQTYVHTYYQEIEVEMMAITIKPALFAAACYTFLGRGIFSGQALSMPSLPCGCEPNTTTEFSEQFNVCGEVPHTDLGEETGVLA